MLTALIKKMIKNIGLPVYALMQTIYEFDVNIIYELRKLFCFGNKEIPIRYSFRHKH